MSPSSMSKPSGDAGSKPEEFAARVLGESIYDRVTSFLMAVVLGAMMIVGLMGVIYITNQAYASRVTAPLQIIEVSGGGGGSPEGTPGSTEKIDVPGADAGPLASNNEEEAGDFEEPAVQATPGAMIDAAAEAGSSLAEVDFFVLLVWCSGFVVWCFFFCVVFSLCVFILYCVFFVCFF